MKKYNITAAGHDAVLEFDEMDATSFSGTISAPDFGSGRTCGSIDANGLLTGTAQLDDHIGSFTAIISGNNISGSVSVRLIFINETASFSGTLVA
jgi:hypothetical protein